MFRFVMAFLALIAIQNLPVPSNGTSLRVQAMEAPAPNAAEDQPFAMVSAGWLDGAGGLAVSP